MKVKTKVKSGSLKIDPAILEDAKRKCKERGIAISFFGTEAVKEKVKRDFR